MSYMATLTILGLVTSVYKSLCVSTIVYMSGSPQQLGKGKPFHRGSPVLIG